MIGLLIVCWAYLIFTLMVRIVSYDKRDKHDALIRMIDNTTIIVLILMIYFLIR